MALHILFVFVVLVVRAAHAVMLEVDVLVIGVRKISSNIKLVIDVSFSIVTNSLHDADVPIVFVAHWKGRQNDVSLLGRLLFVRSHVEATRVREIQTLGTACWFRGHGVSSGI